MLKRIAVVTLVISNLLLSSFPSQAEGVQGDSILCKQRNLLTSVALSTRKYTAAICFENDSSRGYYIGQSKSTNDRIFLPLVYQDNPSIGENLPYKLENGGLTYKAANGQYAYQVFLKGNSDGCGTGEWVSLTVFKNGSKLYHQKVNKFLSTSDC